MPNSIHGFIGGYLNFIELLHTIRILCVVVGVNICINTKIQLNEYIYGLFRLNKIILTHKVV